MHGTLVAVTAFAVATCVALAVWWLDSGRLRTGGDEPHYLIVAASVLRDGDLDVRNNYEEDARTAEIYGPVFPHVTVRDSGTWPAHAPGLGVLLAIPFGAGGTLGARVALCLFAGLLAWSVWWWFRDRLPAGDTALVVAGLLSGPTILFGYVAGLSGSGRRHRRGRAGRLAVGVPALHADARRMGHLLAMHRASSGGCT